MDEVVFDERDALARVEGDRDLLVQLIDLHHETCGESMQAVRDAVDAGDVAGLRTAAHSLKGSLGSLGGRQAAEAARAVEYAARDGAVDRACDLVPALCEAMHRLNEALSAYAGR